jgi:MoxR-like ATPase
MAFHVYETGQTISAKHRPIVIITSNNEKELPDAFLRRCFFHYIRFPDTETLRQIIDVHFPNIKPDLVRAALQQFFEIRETPGLKKKPSTSEVLDWLKLLLVEDLTASDLQRDGKDALPKFTRCIVKERTRCTFVRNVLLFWPGGHGNLYIINTTQYRQQSWINQ